MKKGTLTFIIVTAIVWLSVRLSLPRHLLSVANKITMSGSSFDRMISKRHILIKGLIIDSTLIKPEQRKELERFLNYQRTAQEDIQKLIK